jgi:dienelactone hydrolase
MRYLPLLALAAVLGLAAPADARILIETLDPPVMLEEEGELVGLLTLPSGAEEVRRPAVVIVPDLFGPDRRSDPYVEQLVAAGLAVLEVTAEPEQLTGAQIRRAIAALARHPGVDPARIGLLAFGQGAFVAAGTFTGRDPFAARVLLYPGCGALLTTLPPEVPTPRGRLLLLHGAADEANLPADCTALSARLAGPSPTRRIAYRGAGYAWDFPQAEPLSPWRHPAPGLAGRVTVRGWPALTAMSAAEATAFLAVMPATGW